MTALLIIAAVAAAVYIYAAISYYYGFKDWRPMCSAPPLRGKGAKRIKFVDKGAAGKGSGA